LRRSQYPEGPQAPRSQLSEPVNHAMEARGLAIKDLAAMLDVTYEHARRLVRGEGVPSRPLIRRLAEALHLSFDDLNRLATADKIRMKFGTVPLELAGKNPELEPIERVWTHLTPDQKRDATTLVTSWAAANQAHGAAAAAGAGGGGSLTGKAEEKAPNPDAE
jgi:transcriptional regulator with XRE-family HTH domain